jgi:hypothetical protein
MDGRTATVNGGKSRAGISISPSPLGARMTMPASCGAQVADFVLVNPVALCLEPVHGTQPASGLLDSLSGRCFPGSSVGTDSDCVMAAWNPERPNIGAGFRL